MISILAILDVEFIVGIVSNTISLIKGAVHCV